MFGKKTKQEKSWILYDWANSGYSIIITTAIFPIFYKSLVSQETYLASWAFANSIAGLIIAILAPILGTLADYKNRKKGLFSFFFAIGVASTLAMPFIGDGKWMLAIGLYITSLIGFTGANLFYDAFLVDVTKKEQMDQISAAGFGWGYIGSAIPFIISLLIIIKYETFGFKSSSGAVKVSFIITGLWWLIFSLPFLKNVKQKFYVPCSKTPVKDSFKRLSNTFKNIKSYKSIFVFLGAYFFYIEGVNTIIRMATPIALGIGIKQNTLLAALLMVQIVAFPCAIIYGKLARIWSGRTMIFAGIFVYVWVVMIAFFMPEIQNKSLQTAMFWTLSMLVASSQGGIQALSRSYYAKRIPENKSSEFFGFYNIVGKFSAIIGPLLVGFFTLMTGQERFGILSVLFLFLAGALILKQSKT